jgi:RNA polymerase sigma factor for flagellar operon FliA
LESQKTVTGERNDWKQLVRNNMPLVKFCFGMLTKKRGLGHLSEHDIEELFAAGRVGLVQAAKRFDKKKHTKFASYAVLRIRGAMLDEIRSACRNIGGMEMPRHSYNDSERAHELIRQSQHGYVKRAEEKKRRDEPARIVDKADFSEFVNELMELLTEQQIEVLRKTFEENKSLKEIGAEFGVTDTRICQIKAEALGFLKRALSRRGYMMNGAEICCVG